MPIQYKIRRGPASTANSVTLTEGELYMDTTNKNVRIHDGTTVGGTKLLTQSDLASVDLSGKVDKINITAGTVGSGSAIPIITYNAQGQITSVSTSALNIPANIATESYVNTQISGLVNSAPAALDTLKELATALGNDSNFSTTITNSLATKQSTLVSGTNIKTINNTSLLGSGNITIPTFSFLSETNTPQGMLEVITNTLTTSFNGAFFNTGYKPFSNEAGCIGVDPNYRQFLASSNLSLPATFEFWFRSLYASNGEYIFSIAGQNGNSFSITRNGGVYYSDVTGIYGGTGGGSSTLLAANQWNHVAIYLSSTGYKFWFNGTSVGSGTFPVVGADDYRMTNPRTGMYLGGHYAGWPQPNAFYGRILVTSGDKYNTTGNITVPTASFTNSATTQYLLQYVPLTQSVNSSVNVNASNFVGDGSKLTNVNALTKVFAVSLGWQQTVSIANYTSGEQESVFNYTFTPPKTGYMKITYKPNDFYAFTSIGIVLFALRANSPTLGGSQVISDWVKDNITYGSNPHGPYSGIISVTANEPVTLKMSWLLQSFSGSNYFNYSGNGMTNLLTFEYVNKVSSISEL